MTQEVSWTLVNITYMTGSYLMFHWVRGVPFEFNSGAYDHLNMWEQIDNGHQYTPAKKFLLTVPIVLFLLSTHYTHYDLTYFIINFLALMAVVIPKLPLVSIRKQAASECTADHNSRLIECALHPFQAHLRMSDGERCTIDHILNEYTLSVSYNLLGAMSSPVYGGSHGQACSMLLL